MIKTCACSSTCNLRDKQSKWLMCKFILLFQITCTVQRVPRFLMNLKMYEAKWIKLVLARYTWRHLRCWSNYFVEKSINDIMRCGANALNDKSSNQCSTILLAKQYCGCIPALKVWLLMHTRIEFKFDYFALMTIRSVTKRERREEVLPYMTTKLSSVCVRCVALRCRTNGLIQLNSLVYYSTPEERVLCLMEGGTTRLNSLGVRLEFNVPILVYWCAMWTATYIESLQLSSFK